MNNEKKIFADAIVTALEKYHGDFDYHIQEVTKEGDQVLTGISMVEKKHPFQEGPILSPIIYVEDYFRKYSKGEISMDDAVEDIYRTGLKAHELKEQMDKDILSDHCLLNIHDYEKMKGMLTVCVCDTAASQRYLSERPHMEKGDFSAYYKLLLPSPGNEPPTITVNNQMMEAWGIDTGQLHQDALSNMRQNSPYILTSLVNMMQDMLLENKDIEIGDVKDLYSEENMGMFVLTNQKGFHGSGYFFDDELLSAAAEKYGDYFILPSSIHELLLIPVRDDDPEAMLMQSDIFTEMVRDVNMQQVLPEDFLSDRIHFFDSAEGAVLTKEEFVNRMEELIEEQEQKGPRI